MQKNEILLIILILYVGACSLIILSKLDKIHNQVFQILKIVEPYKQ